MVINVPKEIRTKNDGVECEEFCNGELHEKIYQRYLEHLYFQFCLQNGTFQMNEELSMEADVDQHNSECLIVDLSKQLEKYFDNVGRFYLLFCLFNFKRLEQHIYRLFLILDDTQSEVAVK